MTETPTNHGQSGEESPEDLRKQFWQITGEGQYYNSIGGNPVCAYSFGTNHSSSCPGVDIDCFGIPGEETTKVGHCDLYMRFQQAGGVIPYFQREITKFGLNGDAEQLLNQAREGSRTALFTLHERTEQFGRKVISYAEAEIEALRLDGEAKTLLKQVGKGDREALYGLYEIVKDTINVKSA